MASAEITITSVGIHNVLIASDLTHHSDAVVAFGLDFARLVGAHAEIAYVLPAGEYALAGGEGILAGRDAARRDLVELKSRLRRNAAYDDESDQRVMMLEGPVAECLLQCACDKKIDLIVVGTHGRGGIAKALLGSVAEKLFRHSSVPVLTIGPNIHHTRGWDHLRQVLAPCDLTPKSHPAVKYACDLAKAHNSKVTVLYVVDDANEGTRINPDRIKASILERLVDIVGRNAEGLDLNYKVAFGRVAPTILDAACSISAELIVLGIRPSSGVLDRFQWPIAYELVREATCPVLTMRGKTPAH